MCFLVVEEIQFVCTFTNDLEFMLYFNFLSFLLKAKVKVKSKVKVLNMGKTNQLGKKHTYPAGRKSYSGSRKGIGGPKKKHEEQHQNKRATTTYFDKLIQEQNKNKSE